MNQDRASAECRTNYSLEDVILPENHINEITKQLFDDLSYDKTQALVTEWLEEAAPCMEGAIRYDKLMFMSRLIYCHGFAHGITLFNDVVKTLVSESE